MINCINQLNTISQKKERLIIGLMSGTSLDGLDIALCKIKGSGLSTKAEVIAFETIPYTGFFKEKIREICFRKLVDLEQVCVLNAAIGKLHGDLVNWFLKSRDINTKTIDLIASHGQTIYHSPTRLRQADGFLNSTLQIGDADHIASITGIITLSDFRQKNIAQGKEGAPLALYGDYLLFSNSAENRILLNIGGIANFTLLSPSVSFDDVLCTDTGPGNTLMNQYVYENFNQIEFDRDAEIALTGTINNNLLKALLDHPFFTAILPKTTGPELFNLKYLNDAIRISGINDLSHQDVMATLNRFTAESIVIALRDKAKLLSEQETVVYVSGGGAHNPLLISNLKELLPKLNFKAISDLGTSADAKEALLFAVLANETLAGDYTTFGKHTLSMGKISLPK